MDKEVIDKKWFSKRRKTYIAFCGISFGLGFEISLMFPSLYFYMHDIIKTKNAKLFYGIALSAYPVSGIIGAFTVGKYSDRTKRTRIVILFLLYCEIIGNFIYSFPYSPWFPIAGRFIAGFGDVACMVIVAEIQRSYEFHEITSKISATVMCFSIGFVFSPGATIFFKLFDFYIGNLHVVYANMASLCTTVIFIILWVCTYFMVSDLSREYDLKDSNRKLYLKKAKEKVYGVKVKQEEKNEYFPLLQDERNIENNEATKEVDVFKSILTSFDLCLLLLFCFVCSFILFGLDTMVSLIGSAYFNFGVRDISIIYIIDGTLYGFVLIGLGKLSIMYADFYIILFAVGIEILGLISILSLQLYHLNIYFNYVCLVLYIIAFSSAWCIEEVLTRSLFGKLVPSSCQSYAEGIRRSTSNIAFIISGMTTSALFEYLTIISSVLIALMLVLLAIFYYRRNSLLNPTPQFYFLAEEECMIAE